MANLRILLRGLARTPLFAAVAILSLALGIGANTAMFSLINQVLLRTLPVRNPHELVYLYSPGPWQGSMSDDESGGPSFSYPMFRELEKAQTPFVGLAAARSNSVSLAYKNNASHGTARLISGNYFDLLGVRPAIGRLFTADDDRTPGAHPVAVLSHGYWTLRFGADIGVLNQTILVNGFPMTIVGVTQKGFTSERLGSPPDVYVPITMQKDLTPERDGLSDRQYAWISLFGRLKPGVTQERAEVEINVPYAAQVEQDIQLLRNPRPDFLQRFKARRITLKPGQYGRGGLREEVRVPLLLLLGMTLLVLLIACANVANLQLARGAARTREVAVRLAMGASRIQLVRQLLWESCVLAIAGGVLGLLTAHWTLRAILAGIPAARGMQGFLTTEFDARVLLFCLGLSVLTGMLFGLFPALQASKPDLTSSLKDQAGQISSTRAANAFRKTLVTAQVAFSLLLLISGGLFAKTLIKLARADLGIRVDHLITFSILPKLSRYTDQRIVQLHEQLTDRLAAIPGVMLVSSADVPAIAGGSWSTSISVEGYTPTSNDGVSSHVNQVGADYFRSMGMALIAGREFTRSDNAAAPKVAIVNEAFVKRFLPNQNPLGRHILRGKDNNMTIVGVVKDAKYSSIREEPPSTFYPALQQSTRWFQLHFYLRTAVPPETIGHLIQREVAALDPNLPIRDLKTMETQLEENTFAERLFSVLTGTFAGLATVLAAIGLYGVLAFNVARRTREIGIRMALGAESGHVRGLVVREVGLMLAIGTAAGAGLAAAAGKLVQSILYEMKPWDVSVYGAAALLLWLVALGAAYIPARRATTVDPMVALRYE